MAHRRSVLGRLRRGIVVGVALGVLVAGAGAQRPARPIARPPRPDRPLVPGRFNPATTGGVPSGPLPGVFAVVAIDLREGTVRLRDDGGRIGNVHVEPDLFDLESLRVGDSVEVDFVVPEPGSTKFVAAGIWKVER